MLRSLPPPGLIPRPEYENRLEAAIQSICSPSYLGSNRRLVVTNPETETSGETFGATGKSTLVSVVLRGGNRDGRGSTESGNISHVLWLDLDLWRQENSTPARCHHELLLAVAQEMSEFFSSCESISLQTVPISLLSCSVEELQFYIRRVAVALLSCKKQMHKARPDVILVLDGVIHPSEVAIFGYLGLPTIITSRLPRVLENSSDLVINVRGFSSPHEFRSMLTVATGSKDISGPSMRLMECTQSCVIGTVYLPFLIKMGLIDSTTFSQKQQIGVVDCIREVFHKLPPLDRERLILLGTLPKGLVLSWNLCSTLWDTTFADAKSFAKQLWRQGLLKFLVLIPQKSNETDTEFISTFDAQTIIDSRYFEQEGTCIMLQGQVMDCLREIVLSDTDETLQILQAESLKRLFGYVTDHRVFLGKHFDSLERRAIVSCWEHIIKLSRSEILESPIDAYANMIKQCDIPKNRQYMSLIRGFVAVIVNSIESYHVVAVESSPSKNFRWRDASKWAVELLIEASASYSNTNSSKHSTKVSVDFETVMQTCRSACRVLVGNKLFEDASLFLLSISSTLFSLAEPGLSHVIESDVRYFIGKCLYLCQRYEEALKNFTTSLESIGVNVQDTTLQHWQHPDIALRISMIGSTLTCLNRPAEVSSWFRSKLVKMEDILTSSTEELSSTDRVAFQEILISSYLQFGKDLSKHSLYMQKSKKVIEKSLALALKIHGDAHPVVVANLSILLNVCCSTKKYEKALPLGKRLVSVSRSVYGIEHPLSISSILSMINVMTLSGASCESAVRYAKRSLGAIVHVSSLRRENERDLAAAGHEGQLPIAGFEELGDGSFAHIRLLQILSNLSKRSGDIKAAKAYTKKAIQILVGLENCHFQCRPHHELAQHVQLGHLYSCMGSLCLISGKPQKSISLLKHALERYCDGGVQGTVDVGSMVTSLLILKDAFLQLGALDEAVSVCHGVVMSLTNLKCYIDENCISSNETAFILVAFAETLKCAGNILMLQGETESAAKIFSRVLAVVSDPRIPPVFNEEKFWDQRERMLETNSELFHKANFEAFPDTNNENYLKAIKKSWSTSLNCAKTIEESSDSIINQQEFLKQLEQECLDDESRSETVPLHVAVREGHMDIVKLLIEKHETDVNAADDCGFSALHLACLHGQTELAAYLLDHKADKDQTNRHGDTALMLATSKGCRSVVSLLLQHGVNRALENVDGLTAADIAACQRDHGVLQLLTNDDCKAVMIQSAWRMSKVRKAYVVSCMVSCMATRIQSAWRARHIRLVYGPVLRFRLLNARSEGCVIRLQCKCRTFLAKRTLLHMRLADISKRVEEIVLARQIKSTLLIQSFWRLRRHRKNMYLVNVQIDGAFTLALAGKTTCTVEAFLQQSKLLSALSKIQRCWRLHFRRRMQAVTKIQHFWTTKRSRTQHLWKKLLMKTLSDPSLSKSGGTAEEHIAATKIQKCWHSYVFQPPRLIRPGSPDRVLSSYNTASTQRRRTEFDTFLKAALILSGSNICNATKLHPGPVSITFQSFLNAAKTPLGKQGPTSRVELSSSKKWTWNSSDEE